MRICRDEQRRHRVRSKHRNGLDYVEVGPTQLTLKLFFIDGAPEELTSANFRIDGGARIRDIRVTGAYRVDRTEDDLDDHWLLTVDRFGDFSTYTLHIVKPDAKGRAGNERLEGFDPRYSHLKFTFKSDCPSDLDCRAHNDCPPTLGPAPEINYLAKDYASFRQLILDRMAVLMPEWNERHIPDIGITLVELLAYAGDYLSYYQDAVATEAYLDTARRRISVRRHARLIDYALHEGCNARAWVIVETSADDELDANDTYFITGSTDEVEATSTMLTTDELRNVPSTDYDVFEPVVQDQNEKIKIYKAHNEISFYTWGDRECCLPSGSTTATLLYNWKTRPRPEPNDRYVEQRGQRQPGKRDQAKRLADEPTMILNLTPGDVLIFEEVKGAKTGNPADADPSHRHAVRLTKVVPTVDELYGKQIVEIEWAEEDALPFALCISSIGPAADCCKEIVDVSVARGNVILIDHGRTVETESFDVPPAEDQDPGCDAIGQPSDSVQRPALFNPTLKFAPLTHSEQFPRPRSVARQQARLLGQLLEHVRQYIDALWRKARDGRFLTADELNALQTIYSRKAMIDVGLVDGVNEQWKRSSPAEQAEAIANLVLDEERWLARKISRVETLRARAAADYKLEPAAAKEISGMFGEQFGRQLSPSSSALFGAANRALLQDPRESSPNVRLSEVSAGHVVLWEPRRDLLDSDGDDRHFVAEIADDSRAHLRFGNGELGRAPEASSTLVAKYRVGNGKVGNVGAETITRIVFRLTKKSGITLRPRNPLPARGGTEPETIAEAKLFAPGAFRKQLERAVIADDYARLTERNYKIQRAAASLAWTGSWYEASVAVDPLADEPAPESLLPEIERYLDQYRRIGHGLRVNRARYVPIGVEMEICVLPNYLRGHVKEELGNLFSNRRLPDGRLGFFHPDNLSFGDGIYLSKLIAAAQGVTGVESVRVAKLQRLFEEPHNEIENGVLLLDAFEIAQLDNDPNFPERGNLALVLKGGR